MCDVCVVGVGSTACRVQCVGVIGRRKGILLRKYKLVNSGGLTIANLALSNYSNLLVNEYNDILKCEKALKRVTLDS